MVSQPPPFGAALAPSKQQKVFVELTKAMTQKIFTGSAIRIMACISGTLALLDEYEWTPPAVLIDQFSARCDPDSHTSLPFSSSHGLLAEDFEKVKLAAISSGHNELADQLGVGMLSSLGI